MSIGASPKVPVESEPSAEAAVEIVVHGRWDALAVSEVLIPSTRSSSTTRVSAGSCTPELRVGMASRSQMRCARSRNGRPSGASRPVRAAGRPDESLR